MLKIKLLLLSLFVFCVEQNNITASPYQALSGLSGKKEKSWREKIKKWSQKNWKMLSWILGGLAVGGAAAFAHKKGFFGGEGFSTGGGNSGSNNMFGGQFNGKNIFTKEEIDKQVTHLFENEKFFVLALIKGSLIAEANHLLTNLSGILQDIKEKKKTYEEKLKNDIITDEEKKDLESALKIIEKIKTEDDLRNGIKQKFKDKFDGIEKLEKIYKRYLGDAGNNKIFDQLLLLNLFKSNETFQDNNDVFLNFNKNIHNDHAELSNNIKNYTKLAGNYFSAMKEIIALAYDHSLIQSLEKDEKIITLIPLFNQLDSVEKKGFIREEFDKFIGRVPQLVQEIIDEKEDLTFEEALHKKFVIFFNTFLSNVDQMIKDRELAFEAQREEYKRKEQERIEQMRLAGEREREAEEKKIKMEPVKKIFNSKLLLSIEDMFDNSRAAASDKNKWDRENIDAKNEALQWTHKLLDWNFKSSFFLSQSVIDQFKDNISLYFLNYIALYNDVDVRERLLLAEKDFDGDRFKKVFTLIEQTGLDKISGELLQNKLKEIGNLAYVAMSNALNKKDIKVYELLDALLIENLENDVKNKEQERIRQKQLEEEQRQEQERIRQEQLEEEQRKEQERIRQEQLEEEQRKEQERIRQEQLEEEQRQEQERIRQKQLEDDNNKAGDKPQTFSSEKTNEDFNDVNNKIVEPVELSPTGDKDKPAKTEEKVSNGDTSSNSLKVEDSDGKKDGDEPQSSSSEKTNEDFNDVNNKIVEPVQLSLTGDKDEPVQTDKTSENDDDDDVNASAHLDQIGEGELSAHNSMSNKNEDNHKNEGDGHALSSPDVNADDDEDVDGEEFYERSVR